VLDATRTTQAKATARAALEKARASQRAEAVHVTKRDTGWAVKTEGRARAAEVVKTKQKAVDAARAKAARDGARLIEHGADGKIVRNTKPRREA